MENIFKKFNVDFFKSKKEISWFDNQGLLTLDDNRVVSIEIDDLGTKDSFNGYMVTIYNKQNGVVVKKFFRFKDHLEFTHRNDMKYYHVWLDREQFEWYISKPIDTKVMVKTIFDWIEMFR